MSELKATHIKMVYNGEIYEDFGTVPCTQLYYRKDEADKVIAELEESHKKEVEQLLILNREQANAANRLRDSMEQTIRRQKYKRCLAMAVICFNRAERANCWKEEVKSRKRFEKWLELAQKFKQGLVIGVDEATGTDKTVRINYKEAK